MKKSHNIIVVGFLVLVTGLVLAETLLIESVEKNASVMRPGRGTSMTGVERQYGKAIKKHVAIGEPPISKWVYSDITVYFERNRVLHSVVNRKELSGN